MPWMAKWAGGTPVFLAEARGSRVTDVDEHEYVDVALGDTGAMPGHSPAPTVEAVIERLRGRGGITTMMPTEDAIAVGEQLARRFGVPAWQFALSATDANRFVLRMCRQVQRRSKIMIFLWSYHGTVDETVPIGADGLSAALRDRVMADDEGDYLDWGGVGGTLAGNALSLAAARATLEQVLTDAAYARMAATCARYVAGVETIFARRGVPWSIVGLGARAEFHFTPEPPAPARRRTRRSIRCSTT
jgi:glutamate-1-semialdehyde aminotransferase